MDLQYYPTGAHTAALMWAKFKRPIKHLVEPSAGDGALIRHAKEGFPTLTDEQLPWVAEIEDKQVQEGRFRVRVRDYAREKFRHVPEISVIEIDLRHHARLKELGVKILGYDFMQVQSLATATSILLNPPFREGCAHVLHAWDCLYDGEIVAIVNAETVRNPFSQERQRLVDLIERHGSVEYLQDQFVDEVERKTDVEIALIHLEKVPGQYLDVDALLGGLKRGNNGMGEMDPEVCTALALPTNFIQDTCFRFSQAVEAARKASEAMAIVDHLTQGLGLTLEQMQAKGVGNDFRETAGSIRDAANKDFKERYDDLKKRAWSQIIRSSLLTDKLSNQARRKLEASAESIYELEFTMSNVHGFLAGVIESMGDIYKDMVLDLFDSIIERSSDNVVFYRSWKSNQKHKIGMRIRKTRFIMPRFRSNFGGSLDFECERFLADVDKVIGYLHGVSGDYDGLVAGFRKNKPASGERISTRFFDARWHTGVGTIHFYPRSAEVVEKLNHFVGKLRNWIPGDMAEANQDFKQQYDKGEAFTEEYMEHYRKANRTSYGLDRPAIKLLRELKGKDNGEAQHELDRLDKAIEDVHESKGLHCGPALTTSAPLKAISASPAKPTLQRSEPPEQLLLLAA